MSIDRTSLPEITDKIKAIWQPQRVDHSSGGVAYHRGAWGGTADAPVADLTNPPSPGEERILQIALIATHGGKRWQLPKGTVEPGETSIQTAIREVKEESGLKTQNEGFIETVEYWYWDTFNRVTPMLVCKQVDFYLLRTVGGGLSDVSVEVDAVAWYTPEEALNIMTFKAERATVRKAIAMLDDAVLDDAVLDDAKRNDTQP